MFLLLLMQQCRRKWNVRFHTGLQSFLQSSPSCYPYWWFPATATRVDLGQDHIGPRREGSWSNNSGSNSRTTTPLQRIDTTKDQYVVRCLIVTGNFDLATGDGNSPISGCPIIGQPVMGLFWWHCYPEWYRLKRSWRRQLHKMHIFFV